MFRRDSALFLLYFDFILLYYESLVNAALRCRETFNLGFILFGTRAPGVHRGLPGIVKISVSMSQFALRSERGLRDRVPSVIKSGVNGESKVRASYKIIFSIALPNVDTKSIRSIFAKDFP